ncbi:hypothetical protein QFZ79_002785 [Arthrobacter sp. V4I6]|uniref:hypothetical protein n=1 Tax=unclassified Arthrobacter TaxID=235627 RepID=UPI00277FAB9A|nr:MULTISPECIES: hypothetical protein [unclassified Arthrobacter]MDQ0820494.1 hypothetical protein [Arthrobacter sp. V1I7]MDQ0854674.1 hypothetical protein [Arthrobacter sp. V4I6]
MFTSRLWVRTAHEDVGPVLQNQITAITTDRNNRLSAANLANQTNADLAKTNATLLVIGRCSTHIMSPDRKMQEEVPMKLLKRIKRPELPELEPVDHALADAAIHDAVHAHEAAQATEAWQVITELRQVNVCNEFAPAIENPCCDDSK